MKFTVEKQKDTVIIRPAGRLDSMTSPEFESSLDPYLHDPVKNLLLDCDELDYISSAGLRVILNTARAFTSGPGRFAACSMQDHVREVFEISGFDSVITIYDSAVDFLGQLG